MKHLTGLRPTGWTRADLGYRVGRFGWAGQVDYLLCANLCLPEGNGSFEYVIIDSIKTGEWHDTGLTESGNDIVRPVLTHPNGP